MRLLRLLRLTLLPLAVFPVDVFAQAAPLPSPAVLGQITDASGFPVPSVVIRVEPAAGGPAITVTSGAEGGFRLEGLAPGAYLVSVTHPSHAPWVEVVDVSAGRTVDLRVKLTPAGVSETVTVTATRMPTPVTAVPNTVTVIGSETLEARAAVSDDLASVLEANVPGFGPSLKKLTGRAESFRGRNPLYTINGVPQHTPLRDGERDGHTIDLDFIDRIEVLHGANAVQGIGATGGIINMVTKSPRADGAFSQDVKLSVANSDGLEDDGWSNKLSYLAGKKFGRLDLMGGVAVHKRGLFFDASGDPIGLYPTQGDIMDSTSRSFYARGGWDFTPVRRLDFSANTFQLSRDGDFVAVRGDRTTGRLSSTTSGDPRPSTGEPAVNDVTTVSAEYRDRRILGGEAAVQWYVQDYRALFEGGAFAVFALTPGGDPFLDQSQITTFKHGAKLTWTSRARSGFTPTVGLDFSHDRSEQGLAQTGRTWVPETIFQEAAPFVQAQHFVFGDVLVSGGARFEFARLTVDDFTTLPSSRNTFVAGGSPSFTEVLPNVGVVVPVSRRVSVYSSYSEGFTMPDAGRVLRAVNTPGQDVDTLIDVAPVVARNVEAGGDYRAGSVKLHAAYYRSVSQQGSLLERDAEGIFSVRREATAIDGVDLVADVSIGHRVKAGGSYSWIRGRFDSNKDGRPEADLDGLNIAPNRVNLYLDGGWKALTGRLQVSTLLERAFDGLATASCCNFGGYTTADAVIGVDMRAGTFRFAVENVLDKQYVSYFSQVDTARSNDAYFAGTGRSFTLSWARRF